MEEMLRQHKDVPFGLVLWLPMVALWLQAAISAAGVARRKRREAAGRDGADHHAKAHGLPRLMAPR